MTLRIHTNDTLNTDTVDSYDTLPTVEETVLRLTEQNTDVNAVEVYQAYEVFIAEQEEREEEATAFDIAVEEYDREEYYLQQYEGDQHPSCRKGNSPEWAICIGDTWRTQWEDGSFTVDNVNYLGS
tara:strand:+ start:334 stop:711 length:378 start_codon:yes stop_codon:yes gene_type:complete